MEPSTSGENISQKRRRKYFYDQRQVLDLLLEGGSDEELYESSGSELISTAFKARLCFRQISLHIFSSDLCNSESPKKKLPHERVNQVT